jgi:DNA-nicking Smr family endonuclease
VTPVVIDPHEDIDSLRLKARHEADRMKESFKQSREAFARNERGLAKQLSLRGEAYKDNMVRLNREASTKIFQGKRLMDEACRIRQLTSSLIQSIIKFVVVLMKHAAVRRFSQRHIGSNTIDLHGLFVPEAKLYFDNAVRGARDRGETSLYVIVGKKSSIAHLTLATGFSLIAKLLRKRKSLRK